VLYAGAQDVGVSVEGDAVDDGALAGEFLPQRLELGCEDRVGRGDLTVAVLWTVLGMALWVGCGRSCGSHGDNPRWFVRRMAVALIRGLGRACLGVEGFDLGERVHGPITAS
jgi:hypothetical protein